MSIQRRDFLRTSSLGIAGGLLAAGPAGALGLGRMGAEPGSSSARRSGSLLLDGGEDWEEIRSRFGIDRSYVHMAGLLLSSHPESVGESIEEYRRVLDLNPASVWDHMRASDSEVRETAGRYMGARSDDIGLTTSTTMGVAIVYQGFRLGPGDEILHTTHDHMVTNTSVRYKSEMSGASVRRISLYEEDRPDEASVPEILDRFRAALRPETRVAGVTWVHSNNGVKLPIRAMSEVVAEANRGRDEEEQISFVVDGVHGFGIEDQEIPELGCDFFCAGTHKWIFGPRGSGVVWGRPETQDRVSPLIPSFTRGGWGGRMSPGGFQAFEHRWALAEAFEFHLAIGKPRIQARIHELNTMLKEGLAAMDHVRLYTPRDPAISSGIVCFNVEGRPRGQVVSHLREDHRIIGSTSWGRPGAARLTPGLLTDEADVEACLAAVRGLA